MIIVAESRQVNLHRSAHDENENRKIISNHKKIMQNKGLKIKKKQRKRVQ